MASLTRKPVRFRSLSEDRVLVKPDPASNKTEGGIYLPEQSQETFTGTVVMTGPGKRREMAVGTVDGVRQDRHPMSVKVGDRVCYSKFSGTDLNTPDGEMRLMTEAEIVGVIE